MTTMLEEVRHAALAHRYLTADIPPVAFRARATPEDFVVDEIPAYTPSGEGEHLYLLVQKRGLNTRDALQLLADIFGVSIDACGYAGLKDKHAVTRQWLSLPTAGAKTSHVGLGLGDLQARVAEASGARGFEAEGAQARWLRVEQMALHGNKLRTGHLHGNRFVLTLRDVPCDRKQDVESVLRVIARRGAPNHYGVQRFSRDALDQACAWIVDEGRAPRGRFERKWLVSVLQSAVFNAVLNRRIAEETMDRALRGDCMRKEESGGIFLCEDPDADQSRVDAWEISPTGPMPGVETRPSGDAVLQMESDAMQAFGLQAEHLARVQKYGKGTRRSLRMAAHGLAWSWSEERRSTPSPLSSSAALVPGEAQPSALGTPVAMPEQAASRATTELELRFMLPSGGYATSLLSELGKTEQAPGAASASASASAP